MIAWKVAEPHADHLIVVRIGPRLLPEILLAFLRTNEGQHALRAAGSGASALSLRPSDVARLQIPVPPVELQQVLAELIQASELYHRSSIEVAERRRAVAQGAVERVLRRSAAEA